MDGSPDTEMDALTLGLLLGDSVGFSALEGCSICEGAADLVGM